MYQYGDLFYEPINEIAVQFFMGQIKKGIALSEPVIAKIPGSEKMVIVDGRSRLIASERCGDDTFDAYVIEKTDPEKLIELRKSMNERFRGLN